MQPDNLALAEDIKLALVARTAVDLCYVFNVWMAGPESIRQTRVKIRGENGSNKAAHDESRQDHVSIRDAIPRIHDFEQNPFAQLRRNQQVLDRRRKVFG